MSEKTTLDFKPAHRGLGFHPFSDGMPYASPTLTPKRPLASAAGATLAGPIRVSPQITQPAPVVPVEPVPLVAQQPKFRTPYLAARILAFAFDLTFHGSIAFSLLMGVMALQRHSPGALLESGIFELAVVFSLAMAWAMILAQEVLLGSTPGKKLLGFRLQGDAISILFRGLLFIPSALFMGTGLLWALANRESRCWHDLAVDLQPIRQR